MDNYPSILHKTQTGTQSGFLNWFGRNGSSSTDLNPCGTTTYEPVHGHMRVFGVGGRELALEPIVIPSLEIPEHLHSNLEQLTFFGIELIAIECSSCVPHPIILP